MVEIRVRDMDEQDWPVFRRLRSEAVQESPGVIGGDQPEAGDEERWRGQLRRHPSLVAERDGHPVGIVTLGLHADPGADGAKQAEVGGLWVDPDARGLQIGRRLVQAAARRAFHEGYRSLYFWAGSDDGAAVAFASNLGFRPDSERRSAQTPGAADETAMVLSLTEDPGSVANPQLP